VAVVQLVLGDILKPELVLARILLVGGMDAGLEHPVGHGQTQPDQHARKEKMAEGGFLVHGDDIDQEVHDAVTHHRDGGGKKRPKQVFSRSPAHGKIVGAHA
jgi:hypothetical protein